MSKPYDGSSRMLVLAFDVGTTFSGISYSVLDPGFVPEIKGVNKFPAQAQVGGSNKIPTVIYYDRTGSPKAIGAETLAEGTFEMAEDGGWTKVEWFKLHLRPNNPFTDHITDKLPPLPRNKVAVDVLADFYRYLFHCARTYIQECHANGPEVWASVQSNIKFILSHPNGWGGPQQALLRKAAIMASLIPDTDSGRAQVSFVTEGEASLHFAIQHGLPTKAKMASDGVVIVDAGGGTIDLSVYSQTMNPIKSSFEEISQSQCHLQGSIFVATRAREHLKEYLATSDYLDDLDHIVDSFDKTTKLRFDSNTKDQYIRFGNVRDNDPEHNIRLGQLKLPGTVVATFFRPSVECIICAIQEQRQNAHKRFTHVVLVGGFAASNWLYNQVSEVLTPLGYVVVRPDHYVMKAVADGAVSYYINHYVHTRVSGVTYGVSGKIAYNESDPEHRRRSSQVITSSIGAKEIQPYFMVLLSGNTQIPESNKTQRRFCWEIPNFNCLKSLESPIYSYAGNIETGSFMDSEKEKFSKLCTIEVDLSHLANTDALEVNHGPKGKYYTLYCEVILSFGGTEVTAQLAWKEKGIEKRTPAKVLFEEDLARLPAPSRSNEDGATTGENDKSCSLQ